MRRTIEGIIGTDGRIRLLESVRLSSARRVVVTILDEPAEETGDVTALFSEQALAEDWNRPEEDAAWAHLQPAR